MKIVRGLGGLFLSARGAQSFAHQPKDNPLGEHDPSLKRLSCHINEVSKSLGKEYLCEFYDTWEGVLAPSQAIEMSAPFLMEIRHLKAMEAARNTSEDEAESAGKAAFREKKEEKVEKVEENPSIEAETKGAKEKKETFKDEAKSWISTWRDIYKTYGNRSSEYLVEGGKSDDFGVFEHMSFNANATTSIKEIKSLKDRFGNRYFEFWPLNKSQEEHIKNETKKISPSASKDQKKVSLPTFKDKISQLENYFKDYLDPNKVKDSHLLLPKAKPVLAILNWGKLNYPDEYNSALKQGNFLCLILKVMTNPELRHFEGHLVESYYAVVEVLTKGMNINDPYLPDRDLIHLASCIYDTRYLSLFLEKGANAVSADKNGNTPLHYAAHNDCLENFGILMAKGASIHHKNNKGEIPFVIAAKYPHGFTTRNMLTMAHFYAQFFNVGDSFRSTDDSEVFVFKKMARYALFSTDQVAGDSMQQSAYLDWQIRHFEDAFDKWNAINKAISQTKRGGFLWLSMLRTGMEHVIIKRDNAGKLTFHFCYLKPRAKPQKPCYAEQKLTAYQHKKGVFKPLEPKTSQDVFSDLIMDFLVNPSLSHSENFIEEIVRKQSKNMGLLLEPPKLKEADQDAGYTNLHEMMSGLLALGGLASEKMILDALKREIGRGFNVNPVKIEAFLEGILK